MERIEYADCYVCRRGAYYSRCKETEFEVDIEDGVVALFAETKNKRKSREYHLVELAFDKNYFDKDDVDDYWSDWDIQYVDARKKGKKYYQIKYFIGEENNLVEGGYIIGMYRNAHEFSEKKSFISQYNSQHGKD